MYKLEVLTFSWIINNWFPWLYRENNLPEDFYILFQFITLLDILFWYSKLCQSKWTITGKIVLVLPVGISKTYCFWFLWIGNFVFHKYLMNCFPLFSMKGKKLLNIQAIATGTSFSSCSDLSTKTREMSWSCSVVIFWKFFFLTCNRACHHAMVDKIWKWLTLSILWWEETTVESYYPGPWVVWISI